MGIMRSFAENHAHPKGFLGRVVAWRLARATREPNDWAVSLLELQATDEVLEVGFGPGLAIEKMAAIAREGRVAGIDSSEVMVQAASKRNAAAIAEGRVELKRATLSSLPFPNECFDKALAIQVLYFLANPVGDLRELLRVMKPGGCVILFIEAKEKLAREGKLLEGIYRLYTPQEATEFLQQAGFARTRVETRWFSYGDGICVIGYK